MSSENSHSSSKPQSSNVLMSYKTGVGLATLPVTDPNFTNSVGFKPKTSNSATGPTPTPNPHNPLPPGSIDPETGGTVLSNGMILPKAQPGSDITLLNSDPITGADIVKGFDFNNGPIDYDKLFHSFKYMGFQATNFALAVDQINDMIKWRLSDENKMNSEDKDKTSDNQSEKFGRGDPLDPSKVGATIFLGFTSNMVSCGNRDIIRYLCQHKMISAIVTTAGGVEEDFMKCTNHHYMGDFKLDGVALRLKGHNRIGNLLVPNLNYCSFEDWMMPILDKMLIEQNEKGVIWTPSKVIDRLGREINNPESIYYWCHVNKIPVFCPAITDGSIGDMMFFHSQQKSAKERLRVDLVGDMCKLNDMALTADKAGAIILGGGVIKHHIMNANLMRNGADWVVYVNTGIEYDGSDTGATPDEAVSWGKIKLTAKPVKIYGEASFIFPLLVAQTFAKTHPNSPTANSASISTSMNKATVA